jgi:dCMP deaminase
MAPRPSFDETFMDICRTMARRTTCPRRAVGAVIARDNHVLTTGYNGAPKGFPHPIEVGCIREELGIPSGQYSDVCPCLHAEQNAIVQAALFGVSVRDGALYCTTQPCMSCARMIINSGIRKIVFEHGYADPLSIGLLTTAGVQLFQWDDAKKKSVPFGQTNTFAQAQELFKKNYLLQLTKPKARAKETVAAAKTRSKG